MKIHCKFCGGSNEIYPDEKVTRCAFCGGTIAVEDNEALRKLILVHTRDNAKALAALQSFALKKRGSPVEGKVTGFYFVPFLRNNTGRTLPSVAENERLKHIKVLQPYGVFTFLEDVLKNETDFEINTDAIARTDYEEAPSEGIIYIPIYEIRYNTGKGEDTAYIVGETWQVIAESIEEEHDETAIKAVDMRLPALLFAMFLIPVFIVHGTIPRLAAVIASGAIAHIVLSLKGRGTVPWKSGH